MEGETQRGDCRRARRGPYSGTRRRSLLRPRGRPLPPPRRQQACMRAGSTTTGSMGVYGARSRRQRHLTASRHRCVASVNDVGTPQLTGGCTRQHRSKAAPQHNGALHRVADRHPASRCCGAAQQKLSGSACRDEGLGPDRRRKCALSAPPRRCSRHGCFPGRPAAASDSADHQGRWQLPAPQAAGKSAEGGGWPRTGWG